MDAATCRDPVGPGATPLESFPLRPNRTASLLLGHIFVDLPFRRTTHGEYSDLTGVAEDTCRGFGGRTPTGSNKMDFADHIFNTTGDFFTMLGACIP